MYSKQQASAVRQQFWTIFGQYMAPVPSASGEKVNWINYKTGVKGILFRSDADNNRAEVAIEISLADKELQKKYFEIFEGLKKQFQKIAGKDWDWNVNYMNEHGVQMMRISIQLNQINIFRESDRPDIISFLKKNLTALDLFWSEFKTVFEMA